MINDFKMILAMNFFTAAKEVPVPHLGVVSIMEESSPRIVRIACSEPAAEKAKEKMLYHSAKNEARAKKGGTLGGT